MTPYRIGHCPQCDTPIMVRSAGGQWNSIKPNYRQIDCTFPDGHRLRVPVCERCVQQPNMAQLMTAILHDDSEACDATVKTALRARGVPVQAQLAERAIQGRSLSAHEQQWRFDREQRPQRVQEN